MRERRRRAAHLGDRDRAVERDDRRGLQPLERGVEQIDLRPVGVLGRCGARMQRGDRGLHLIGAGAAVAHRLVDQRQALGDHARFQRLRSWSSSSTIAPSRVEARRRARMLQQQQRREPHDLGLGREQAQQQAREPDRLLAQAARAPRRRRRSPNSPR